MKGLFQKIYICLISISLLILIVQEGRVAAEETDHTLVVDNGTGDGDYPPGTVVDIAAVSPSFSRPWSYHFVEWTGDIESVADIYAPSTTIELIDDTTITAKFDPHSIVVQVDDGGSMEPVTPLTDQMYYDTRKEHKKIWVEYDTDLEFTITADPGYEVYDVIIDGVRSLGTRDSYTFSNIEGPHTIYAKFSLPIHTITSSGPISPNGTFTVAQGSSMTFDIVTANGYRVRNVVVDSGDEGARDSYTFDDISRDHTISAEVVMDTGGTGAFAMNSVYINLLIVQGYFDQTQYENFIANITFQEVFSHFNIDSLFELLLREGHIRDDISDKQELLQKLLEKGLNTYKLGMRPDGILTAIGDVRRESLGLGSLYEPVPSDWDWITKLNRPIRVKEALEALFEIDRSAFIDNLSLEGFLKLLGAYGSEDTNPQPDPILAYTWYSVTDPVENMDPTCIRPSRIYRYHAKPSYASFRPTMYPQEHWKHGGPHFSDIDPSGFESKEDYQIENMVEDLMGFPNGKRIIRIDAGAQMECIHFPGYRYGIEMPTVDRLKDASGNILFRVPPDHEARNRRNPVPLCFPSMDEVVHLMRSRTETLMSRLKEREIALKALGRLSESESLLDGVLLDYEKNHLSYWWFRTCFKNGNTYNYDPFFLDPRADSFMRESGLTEGEIRNMHNWNDRSQERFKWDTQMYNIRQQAIYDGVFSVARKYFPDAISSNWGDSINSITVPTSKYWSSGIGNWGAGAHIPESLMSGSYYAWLGQVETPEGVIVTTPPTPYHRSQISTDEYYTVWNSFLYGLNSPNKHAAATSMRERPWLTAPIFREKFFGPNARNTSHPDSFWSYKDGTGIGGAMAEFWFRTAASTDHINYWNPPMMYSPFDLNQDGNIDNSDLNILNNVTLQPGEPGYITPFQLEKIRSRIYSVVKSFISGATTGCETYIPYFDICRYDEGRIIDPEGDGIIDNNDAWEIYVSLKDNVRGSAPYDVILDKLKEAMRSLINTGVLSIYGTEDKSLLFSMDTLAELNIMLGSSNRRILTDSWVLRKKGTDQEFRRVPISTVAINVDWENMRFDGNIIAWAARAGQNNVYRLILNLEEGEDRFDFLDTSGGNVQVSIRGDSVIIPNAQVYHPFGDPEKEVSKQGFWVVQDISTGRLLSEPIDSLIIEIGRSLILNTIGNKATNADELLEFTVSYAYIGEGDPRFETDGLPANAQFDQVTGDFSWIPTVADQGEHTITFTVIGGELSDSETIRIGVGNYYALNVSIEGEGDIIIDPDLGVYPVGAQVSLGARPYLSYSFNSWSGNVESIQNPITVTMDRDVDITAEFSVYQGGADIVVRSPRDETTFSHSLVVIRGYVLGNIEEIVINDVPTSVNKYGEFVQLIRLTEFGNIITITGDDGSSGTVEKELNLDLFTLIVTYEEIGARGDGKGNKAPIEFKFRANTSRDRNVVLYEWDFDGKGVIDERSNYDNKTQFTFTGEGVYPVMVKVMDENGNTNSIVLSIEVQADQDRSPVILSCSYDALGETAPLQVTFSGETLDDNGDIELYEWDFDGDGIYDTSSDISPEVVKTYTMPGAYMAVLRVIDNEGLTATKEMIINVLPHANTPLVTLEALTIGEGVVPLDVEFTANFSGNNIARYEWDFDGDGIFDRVSDSPQARYTYSNVGHFAAKVKVTDKENLSQDASCEVEVLGIPPGDLELIEPLKKLEGQVPFTVNFKEEVIDKIVGEVETFFFDFDGDGTLDLKCETDQDGKVEEDIEYTYHVPKEYRVRMEMLNSSGWRKRVVVLIKAEASGLFGAAFISNPRPGQTIGGTHVAVSAKLSPRTRRSLEYLKFRYRKVREHTWIDIGDPCTQLPYRVRWDTSRVDDEAYELECVGKFTGEADPVELSIITVIINNSGVDGVDIETVDAAGEYVKQQELKVEESNEVILADGTKVDMPYVGMIDSAETLTLRGVNKSAIPKDRIENTRSKAKLGKVYREINLSDSDAKFDRDVEITIPYTDEDIGTMNEEKLEIFYFNEKEGIWERGFDSKVLLSEKMVTAKINHFSLFALGEAAPLAVGPSIKDEGCFIATAAYGTEMADEVKVLSGFRDKYLLRNDPGRQLVNFYYRHSPPIARHLDRSKKGKAVVRAILRPVVWIVKKIKQFDK